MSRQYPRRIKGPYGETMTNKSHVNQTFMHYMKRGQVNIRALPKDIPQHFIGLLNTDLDNMDKFELSQEFIEYYNSLPQNVRNLLQTPNDLLNYMDNSEYKREVDERMAKETAEFEAKRFEFAEAQKFKVREELKKKSTASVD